MICREHKILIIAEDFFPNYGGIAEYSHNIAYELFKQGHTVTLVAPQLTDDHVFDKACPYIVKRIGLTDIRRKKLGLLKRYEANRIFRKDLLGWLNETSDKSNFDFAIVSSLSEWAKVFVGRLPYVVCIHGGDVFGKRADWIRTLYRNRVIKNIFNSAEHIFANSNYTLRKADEKFGIANKASVTYCGVSEDFKKLATKNRYVKPYSKKITLLMMCRFEHIKACDTVLKAVSLIAEPNADILLKIAGDGPEKKKLLNLVDSLKLRKNVEFLGYVNDLQTKVSLFNEADIFLQAGRKSQDGREEAFGIVFAEAGMCRTPVIAPKTGGVIDVVKDGFNGFLVCPDDEADLCEKIKTLIKEPKIRIEMGNNGFKLVNEQFNYDSIAKKILNKVCTLI